MHKNFYLFQSLIREISPEIIEAKIIHAFTVHKNELILHITKNGLDNHLLINMDPRYPYIFLGNAVKYKSPQYSVFKDIKDQRTEAIQVIPYNKFVILKLENFQIQACFYGHSPNIILYSKEGNFIEAFKSSKDMELPEKPDNNNFNISEHIVQKLIETKPDSTLLDLFNAVCPGFNYKMYDELCFRLKMGGYEKLETIIDPFKIYRTIELFFEELNSGKAYIYRKGGKKNLTLYKSHLNAYNGFDAEIFDSVNKAWQIFIRESQKNSEFDKLYGKLSSALNKRIKKLETALTNISEAENLEQRKQEADLKGNLILTNKHKIPRKSSAVDLVNIFSDKQETITVKLNPKKTAVENAQHYFEKYKDITEKKQIVRIKKESYSKELEDIKELATKLEASDLKDLQKLKEKMIDMNIIQSETNTKLTAESLKYSFKRLIFENKWDIFIGKNGENNDLLTFTFANKWDIWLHAQGVPGSHIVIKVPGKDTTVPSHVIEQAARIAAANSNARHSATVPVIYTTARYVSRIRKAPPGTVSTRNEKVIFVKPLSLNL